MHSTASFMLSILLLQPVLGEAASHDYVRVTQSLPDVPSPPQGTSEWIARSMRMNGLPMTLKSFQSRLEPNALFAHYESMMRAKNRSDSFRSRQGEWQTLSLRARDSLITIQAHATLAGSEGTITVTPALGNSKLLVETLFPRPATTTVINLQEFDDEGIEAEHISLTSMRSAAVEADAFTQTLQRDGWQIVREQPMRAESGGRVLEAQKGAQHAQLTLTRNKAQIGTAIVVVWKKS